MSTAGVDPHAFLPRMPPSIPEVDPALAGLSIAGPASSGPFRVEGARACVSGHQRTPVGRVELYGVGVVDDFRMGADRAANLVVFPGMTRRDFIGRAGLYVETIVVAPDLPLVAVCRGGHAPDEGSGTFSFRLALCGDACSADGPPDSCVSDTRDVVALVGPNGAGIAVGVTPPPSRIEVEPESDGRLRVSVTCVGAEPLALAFAGGSAADVRTAFMAAGHLRGHALGAANGPNSDGLVAASGLTEIDEGIGWLRARVHRTLNRLAERNRRGEGGDAADRDDALMLGLAAIAVGDRAGSERAVTLPFLVGTAEGALLAGRHASCFGDVSFAAKIARHWAEPGSRSHDPSASRAAADEDRELWGLAGQLLADGLLYAATDEVRARLLKRPERPRSAPEGRPADVHPAGGRKLPMAGSRPATVTRATFVAALLDGEPVAPTMPTATPHVPSSAAELPGLFRRSPDAAWLEWRRRVTGGLEDGPTGPASWDEAGSGPVAAHLLLALAHGMLGIAADAPAGRVRLAPRLPGHLTSFTVGGVTVGDVTFAIEFERAGNRHRFTLRPEHAPVPPFVVFEAGVPGGPGEVRIDGVPAELEPRSELGVTVYPVQFALDAPRTVEIVLDEPVTRAQPSTTM